MITDRERSSIKNILTSPHWDAVEHCLNEFCARLEAQPTIMTNEWDTLVMTIGNQGKSQGVKEFVQALHKEALNISPSTKL